MNKVFFFDSIDSTNLELKRLTADGAGAGTAVIARSQTLGRGRLGRTFFSPPGGVYLSRLFDVSELGEDFVSVTCAAAVAVRCAVEKETGVSPDIKWVNDLTVGGKKLCGILSEGIGIGGKTEKVIIGVGINLNTKKTDLPEELRENSVSAAEITGKSFSERKVAEAVLSEFCGLAENFSEKKELYYNEYKKYECVTGKRAVLISGGEKTEVFIKDINRDFSLFAEKENGDVIRVSTGEISLRLL